MHLLDAPLSDLFLVTFNHSMTGMAIVDADGAVLSHNAALTGMLGYRDDALAHMNFSELVHRHDRSSVLAAWRRLWARDGTSLQIRAMLVRRDHTLAWVRLSLAIAREPLAGKEVAVLQIQDDTGLKLATEQLANLSVPLGDEAPGHALQA
ncbi:PAS domain S-box-containing protein [Noviherbaspirillum humi]|uniref:PAS domain S-box-containing protein n=1 Tax=Noviherbaspirillum humi TaxID=1688639 RepID=A0A239F1I6_9BURK|nr:PAS domain S-box protein [Noviherbaspirillum humi]SNS50796.1 PAS domain S-box-containing protein [Noviherbaspirillum humi]